MHVVLFLGYAPETGWAWADALATAASVTVVQTSSTALQRTMERRHDPDTERSWWHLDVLDLPAASLTAPVGRSTNTRRLASLLKLIEAEIGPVDAIHGNFYSALAPFGQTDIPQFITEHSNLFLREQWPEMAGGASFRRSRRLATPVYDRCEAVLATSRDQRLCLELAGVSPERIFDVPHPIDASALTWIDRSDRSTGTRLMVVCGLETTKNLEALVDAMAVLLPTHPNISLDIYGKGTLAADLEHQIELGELSDVVKLRGHVTRAELVDAYHDHDLYVCPSKVESFGRPIVEAMMTGLSVVATPVGIARDLAADPILGAALSITPGWESIDLATTVGHHLTRHHTTTDQDRDALVERFSNEAVGRAALAAVLPSQCETTTRAELASSKTLAVPRAR